MTIKVLWDEGDIWYGCRNLIIGDEEQTRIMDCYDTLHDSLVKTIVFGLVELGEFDLAYTLAIKREFVEIFVKDGSYDSEAVLASAKQWADDWNEAYREGVEEGEERTEVTAEQLVEQVNRCRYY